jgi:outer membrane receptor protein involved in Fe transport
MSRLVLIALLCAARVAFAQELTDAGVDAPVVDAAAPVVVDAPPPPPPPPQPKLSKADLDLLRQAEQAAEEIIEIDDMAPAESASSVHLDQRDLQFRSRTQVSDILRQVPGLMVSQHAGGGKSDQYFIRGFDADHGTDIAIYADGVPVNMPSHGHGQGYADTHFLIPETVNSVDVHKGPYSARFGDFYTAGAMELTTIDQIAGPTIWVAGGAPLAGPHAVEQYNRRIVGMASPEIGDNDTDKSLIAVEIGDTDGPFDNKQAFRQGNALVKWQGKVGRGELKIESNWYEGKWNASGQIPETAVGSLIDRWGSLDPSEGGDTSRATGQIGYTVEDNRGGTWAASAYAIAYRLRLYSDFTLYARDPVHGDEIEQTDSRTTYGLDSHYERHFDIGFGGDPTILRIGAQMRNDDVETALWHDEQRVRLDSCFDKLTNPCNDTFDRIRDTAAYVELNIHLPPHIHVLPALRFEQLVWDVDDLDPATRTGGSTTGGSAGKALVLPKLSVEAELTNKLDLFANGGSGFHSNDARSNVATAGDGSVARALGAEVGLRTSIVPHARFSVDLWYLHLDSELVWNGDDGGTEASGPTRRYGVDLEGSWSPFPWLRFDANVSLAHSAYVHNAGNGDALALAPKAMGQGGVSFVHDNWFVSLRGRGIADRPGNDDNTLVAQGYLIFDLMTGYKPTKKLDLNLTINNVLNSEWREAQFADSSAITPTSPIVEQMHFTPGIPLTATVTAAYQF